jgi:bacterioferritin-associated ferredoxin
MICVHSPNAVNSWLLTQPPNAAPVAMYVCLCNAITDREIRAAADLGARSLDDLSSTLGVATCCRRCADCARNVLDEHLANACATAGDD